MSELFSNENNNPVVIELPNAALLYYHNFIHSEQAWKYFYQILKKTDWKEDEIKIFGKTYLQPRLTALYGSDGKSYSYSGITMTPNPFTSELKEIKNKIEAVSEKHFNTVLLNLYRDGNDSNGWHSDDEKELGPNPFIASLSLGAKRIFHLKHKQDKNLRYKLLLEHGSLLIMKGTTQHFWKHQLPKSKKINSPRINLTFRIIQ